MPATYELIQTTTTTTSSAGITFDNISSNFTDLRIIITPISVVASNYFYLRFNNDAFSNYSFNEIYTNGSGAFGYQSGVTTFIGVLFYTTFGTDSNNGYMCAIDIFDYSNATSYKNIISRASAVTDPNYPGTELTAGGWFNTAAITRIDLVSASTNNLGSGTVASLYGIKAA